MKKIKISNSMVGLLVILVTLITGCSGLGKQANPTEESLPAEEIQSVVSATGEVKPAQWSTLSVSIPGRISEILVQEGDQVQPGQVILRLEGKEEIQAAISAAEFEQLNAQQALDTLNKDYQVDLARAMQVVAETSKAIKLAIYQLDLFEVPSNMDNYSPLEAVDVMRQKRDQAWALYEPWKDKEDNNDTKKDLKDDYDNAQSDYNTAIRWLDYTVALQDANARYEKAKVDYADMQEGPDPDLLALAEARLKNAQTSVASAQSKLDDLDVKAPFEGIISAIDVREGEWVSPGQPVTLLADLKHLRVETTDLNEIDVARINVGNSVTVTFDALPDVKVVGTVDRISPKSSEGSGVNYTVIIELQEISASLRWGMTAFVDIVTNQ
jgi:multidrug resistance efflux pump